MTSHKAIKILIMTAAILLAFGATCIADANYSYNLSAAGGTMVADETNTYYSGSMANQYSLYINAANAGNASCNHSFSEGNAEITSATDATYSGPTTRTLGTLVSGATLTENIGGVSTASTTEGPMYYEGAIGFTTYADNLKKFSTTGRGRTGSDTHYNISAAVGVGRFTAGLDSVEAIKDDGSGTWVLKSEKKTSSRIGVRSGAYNFTAKYHLKRSPIT
jgi:hypothetical protein